LNALYVRNKILNVAYMALKMKTRRTIIRAKLEPYLGFLHSVQYGKPSLVCDLQELFRHLMDDFVIQFCQSLGKSDFMVKSESLSRSRKGKREYLNDAETRRMMKELDGCFEYKVEIPFMRHGKGRKIATLVIEEALLLAQFLRDKKKVWIPKIVVL